MLHHFSCLLLIFTVYGPKQSTPVDQNRGLVDPEAFSLQVSHHWCLTVSSLVQLLSQTTLPQIEWAKSNECDGQLGAFHCSAYLQSGYCRLFRCNSRTCSCLTVDLWSTAVVSSWLEDVLCHKRWFEGTLNCPAKSIANGHLCSHGYSPDWVDPIQSVTLASLWMNSEADLPLGKTRRLLGVPHFWEPHKTQLME